jgi:hypothetical protein
MATVEQLADANMAQVRALTDRTLLLVQQAWWSLSEWHSPDEFLDKILPIITGAQVQTAALTDAYLAAVVAEALGTATGPIGLDPEQVTNLRMNTTMADAYARPFHTVWYQQSKGVDFAQALRLGLERAEHMVTLDIQLARTHASAVILQQTDGVQRYQRVLSGSENCDICSVAARHIYKTSSLMPIHTKCDCTVAPVIEGRPPLASRINKERDFTAPDTETAGPEKKSPAKLEDDIGVEDHGELGPVLVRKQTTYPVYNPRPDGTWSYDGRITKEQAAVEMFGSKKAAELIAKSSNKAL